jgi:hypothetical protein
VVNAMGKDIMRESSAEKSAKSVMERGI